MHYLHALMQRFKPWLLELIWLVATVILVILVIMPIRSEIYGFPFEKPNIFFIMVFITLIRWLIFLPNTPFAKVQIIKGIIGIGAIWVGLYALRQFSLFQNFIDDKGVESITQHLPEARQIALHKYIISEYIFFAAGTMIICVMMPFRMLISIWRTHNLKKA